MQENNSLYFTNLCEWLHEKGFVNDRGWKTKNEEGMGYYSFVKDKFRIDILTDWTVKFDWYGDIVIQIKDCENETYSVDCYVGWLGQKVLNTFNKPISKNLFEELLKYYEI